MHGLTFESVLSVLLLGAISLAFIYHIVLYFFNKDKLLIHYLLYLFFTGLFVFQRTGFIFHLFGSKVDLFCYDYLNEPLQIGYLAMYFNFIIQSIEITKTKNSFLYRSWVVIMTILIGYCVTFFLSKIIFQFENYSIAFTSIRVFIFILTFIMLWQCFKLRHITFQLFILIGSALYFIFGIISFISNLQVTNDMLIYPPEWLMIGSFVDIVLFSIAMSYRNKKQWESMNLILLNDANEIIEMQKKLLEKQTALENERNRIALDMHDDLGSGLTKINYLSQMAMLQVNIDENLKKINQTSSDLVSNMSEIIWAMKEENNSIEDLTSFIKTYAVDYLESNSIEVMVSITENNLFNRINGNYRRSLFLVVKEALHNIVKHAKAKRVELKISSDENLEISIADDGIGFDNHSISSLSNGLKNMKSRVESLHGNFEVIIQNGTKIVFSVPLKELQD
jgi:signal transduction histidine kinase